MQHPERLRSAREAIAALGGAEVVARRLRRPASTVRNWSALQFIPHVAHAQFLMLCEQYGVFWRPPGWDLRVQLRFREGLPVGIVPPLEAEPAKAAKRLRDAPAIEPGDAEDKAA